jgi:hypothetical protein
MVKILLRKRAKNPMAMGITKFNLGFKSTSIGEWHKTMDDSVFFFNFVMFLMVAIIPKIILPNLVIKKSENKDFETFYIFRDLLGINVATSDIYFIF